jgi:hypothetical protein
MRSIIIENFGIVEQSLSVPAMAGMRRTTDGFEIAVHPEKLRLFYYYGNSPNPAISRW